MSKNLSTIYYSMECVFTDLQKERFQQIAKQSIHMRKIPPEVRWKLFFEFHHSVYQMYLQGFRDRNPGLSEEQIKDLIKQETLKKYGKRI